MSQRTREIGALLLLLILFALTYTYNLGGWLISDDEGTDLYEAWQFQQGKIPGVDFAAEQQPLYLFAGKAVLNLAGHQVAPLRLLSAIQVLAGSFILALAVRRIWGSLPALLTLGLILSSGIIIEVSRIFRPDPMMLAWEMVGLAAILLATHAQSRRWWAVAGAAYGMAVLLKPFGVLPVLGFILFFLLEFWRRRAVWRVVLLDGLTFSALFLLVGAGVSGWLYGRTGFYYQEIFNQHASLIEEVHLLFRLSVMLRYYGALFLVNGIFIFILPLALLNRKRKEMPAAPMRLLLWQLVVPLVFVGFPRPFFMRYYIFVIPALAVILARQMQITYEKIPIRHKQWTMPLFVLLPLLFALFATRPRPSSLLLRHETDTQVIADFVVTHTTPDDLLLSDYAMINFLANRASIYEASIIAAGRIQGGIITGELLIQRMTETPVALVMLHLPGGEKEPDHLYYLQDYGRFRTYLDQHYTRLQTFNRQGQYIELYQRQEK